MSFDPQSVVQAMESDKQGTGLLEFQNRFLEAIVLAHQDDQAILDALCLHAEQLVPGRLASIMLLDQQQHTLSFLAVPSAPPEVWQAFRNTRVSEETGSCAYAVVTGEPTYVCDAFTDPRWSGVRELVKTFNIRSCWSQPVLAEQAKPIGSFALTGFEQGEPDVFQQDLIRVCANLVSLVLQRKRKQEELWRLAHHDALTGLPNRYYLDAQLRHSIDIASRSGDGLALMFVDMDNFKNINDNYGHEFGDKVLVEAMERIKSCLRKGDIVSRFGGDEFLILLENLSTGTAVGEVANKILAAFRLPLEIEGSKVPISFSIGVSRYPEDGLEATELLKNADIAMYQAKRKGKRAVCYFGIESVGD